MIATFLCSSMKNPPMKILLLLPAVLLSFASSGQNKKLDSLYQQLEKLSAVDTNRINTLTSITSHPEKTGNWRKKRWPPPGKSSIQKVKATPNDIWRSIIGQREITRKPPATPLKCCAFLKPPPTRWGYQRHTQCWVLFTMSGVTSRNQRSILQNPWRSTRKPIGNTTLPIT